MNELEIIRNLQSHCPGNASLILGIGDDAAVLAASDLRQLICQDMLLDGVHFHAARTDPRLIGHKALAVNLSDIAAMGGEALSASIALALPRNLCHAAFLDPLYEGIGALASRFEVAIAGGDTNIWDGPFAISVTVQGRCHPRGFVRRSGAQVGDIICVTGPLGDSLQTGHHLGFEPRLTEARQIMDAVDIHSMIDVSDGLGKDLRVICQQSAKGALLYKEQIPLRSSLLSCKQDAALDAALNDGEDFELCFSLAPTEWQQLRHQKPDLSLYPIGRIIAGQGLAWELGPGQISPISSQGYEHKI